MEKPQEKALADLRWVPLDGEWEKDGAEGLVYIGGEYEPPASQPNSAGKAENPEKEPPQKYINFGTLLFDQHFKEGRIRMQVEFDEVDNRSSAAIVIQYDPATKDMLTFGISGGGLRYSAGVSGFLFKLMQWASPTDQQQQGTATSTRSPNVWTPLFQVGLGINLKAKRPYDLEVFVRGAVFTFCVDGVEIGKHTLSVPSLPGNPCGIFCGTHKIIHFRNISIQTVTPTAFVVMQFQPAEYEALFKDVIEPICKSEGLQAYRADSTYMPGLVIEDIKRQIAECRVVIAEITPTNPNVYYEVGYADALNKPLILIADRKEGLKPFDVRAYRTIFYENSIGGKNAVENDLRAYLRSIMNK
jgi:hypothetical protein